jgi:SAM-dependent methyltransferase
MIKESLNTLLNEVFAKESLLHAVLSSPRRKDEISPKILIRPVSIKQQLHYQITTYEGPKAIHRNVSPQECQQLVLDSLKLYKQALLCTHTVDYHIFVSDKEVVKILKKSPTHIPKTISHNLEKQYLLKEGEPISYLVELGVMDRSGKVIAKKRDKFKQLNRFLEMINDVLPSFSSEEVLHIIDFGCGKAYLTFALYDYLVRVKGFKVEVHGLDLKKDVIEFCQNLASKLNYKNLNFSLGDIQHYHSSSKIDMVIALHACDTATDAAIEQAVQWQAKVILCVPCCQHELYNQVESPLLQPIIRHGILKERFAALATDAARAQLLEIVGYHTQVLEFIDLEHTPKNLLIRAVKKKGHHNPSQAIQEYLEFKKALKITPAIERLLP